MRYFGELKRLKMMVNMRKFLIAWLSITLLLGMGLGPAWAGMGIAPSKIELCLAPGTSQEVGITVANTNPNPAEVKLSVWDFARDERGMAYPIGPEDVETFRGCGSWVVLPPESIVVDAGGSGTMAFTVEVPGDAHFGTYYTYVKAFGTPILKKKGSIGINFDMNALLLVTVCPEGTENIEGTKSIEGISGSEPIPILRRSAHLKSFSVKRTNFTNPILFTTELENTGNVHLNFTGKIEIMKRKIVVDTIPIKECTLLPKSTFPITKAWEKPPLFGKFTAKFTGDAGLDKPFTSQREFWVISQKLIFGGAGALLLFLALLVIFFKKFKIQSKSRAREGEEG